MESVNDFKKITQGLHYGGAGAPHVGWLLRSPRVARGGRCGSAWAWAAPPACVARTLTRVLPRACCHPPPADPQNQKSMVRTQQDNRQPYSDAMHTVAADWEPGKIVGEREHPTARLWCSAGPGQQGSTAARAVCRCCRAAALLALRARTLPTALPTRRLQ